MQSNSPLARPLLPRNLPLRIPSLFTFLLALAFLFGPVAFTPAAAHGEIKHIVIFWLKQPGNSADRALLARASESFRTLPGVLKVEVGRGLPVRRPGVEQAFDLCVIFTFRNQAALDRFGTNPRHRHAMQTVLKPLVRRYTVFNAAVD